MRSHNVCFLWSNKENYPLIICYPFVSGAMQVYGYTAVFSLQREITGEFVLFFAIFSKGNNVVNLFCFSAR